MDQRGQVLVMVALALTALLAFAGLAVDVGRMMAERRHVQNAADAGVLAACRALVQGASDSVAADQGRHIANVNLSNSPSGTTATIAAAGSAEYDDEDGDGTIEPEELQSGIVVSGTSVRVAIESSIDTLLARAVGVTALETGARARCALQASPAVPIVARRYANPPGPGSGFVDHVATAATSGSGEVDPTDPRGYNGVRLPASESAPGPDFSIYGNESKASNDSSFRGFIALDVRNFESVSSREYYNGVTSGTAENTLKDKEAAYLEDGYKGPPIPAVETPPTGKTQVAALSGNSTSFVVQRFEDQFDVGDRLLLAVYDGKVQEIPDFSIQPPVQLVLPETTTTPIDGPTFEVSRNQAFLSTVTLHLHGDADAAAAGHPEHDILPTPSVTPPAAGDMDQPTWSVDGFVPAHPHGTDVEMQDISTNAIPPGIYTVWLEGHAASGHDRRYPIPVKVGGAVRDFSLENAVLDGSTATLGGTIDLPIYVSTTNASGTRWDAGNGTATTVALSWDPASFTDCDLNPEALGMATIGFSSASVMPTSSGDGALSTLTINTAGLAQGCYRFNLRAHGTNDDGQPVVHVEPVQFTVATTTSNGRYVDIIGFAVFEVRDITANDIIGRAVSGIYADPTDQNLRRAQRPRIVPWS